MGNKIQDLFNKIGDRISSEKSNQKELSEINQININENQETNNIIEGSLRKSADNNPNDYVINMNPEFEYKDKNLGLNAIKNLAKEISSILSNKRDIINKDKKAIIEEVNRHLIENKKIFELIGQLRYIDPGKITTLKERMCFWLNCFNYLIIFTIFFKKWNIEKEKDWKFFFKNVKYSIGGNYFSFHDMQYILYKKILFFPSSYKNNDNLKTFRVNKAEDSKNIEKMFPLLYNPFIIYVPIKGFLKPIIYDEN